MTSKTTTNSSKSRFSISSKTLGTALVLLGLAVLIGAWVYSCISLTDATTTQFRAGTFIIALSVILGIVIAFFTIMACYILHQNPANSLPFFALAICVGIILYTRLIQFSQLYTIISVKSITIYTLGSFFLATGRMLVHKNEQKVEPTAQ